MPRRCRRRQSRAQRGHLARRRSRARGRDRRRQPACGRRAGTVPGCAGADQGPHAGRRLARDVRLQRRSRGSERAERARRRRADTRRFRPLRAHEHARLRRDHRRRERPLRREPQPLGHDANARWLERRRSGRGRRRDVPARARQRRRRLDPDPRLLLWPGRAEAEPGPRSAPRAGLARRDRRGRDLAHGRGLGDGARRDLVLRSARLVQRAGADAPVRERDGHPARQPAHRPDGRGTARHPHRRVVQRRRARRRGAAGRARALNRGGRGADLLRRARAAVHPAHAGRARRLRGRRLVGSRAAHRPPARAQQRDRRLRLRARRAHARADQQARGRALGTGLRRAADADLGDPAADRRSDRRGRARDARSAGVRRRRERLVHGLRQRRRAARREPAAALERGRPAGRRAARRRPMAGGAADRARLAARSRRSRGRSGARRWPRASDRRGTIDGNARSRRIGRGPATGCRRVAVVITIGWLATAVLAAGAQAASWQLDSSFGVRGVERVPGGRYWSLLAAGPQGSVYVGAGRAGARARSSSRACPRRARRSGASAATGSRVFPRSHRRPRRRCSSCPTASC